MKGSRMRNISPPVTDNITEVLALIIKFTQARQKILAGNIKHANIAGYIPTDLDVDAFSSLIGNALDEHIQSQRLVFYDTESIKFGAAGKIELESTFDEYAAKLLEDNELSKYFELQTNKISENSLNYKVADDLLKQKQGIISIFK